MDTNFHNLIRKHYFKMINSIAFYPCIIAICFLALSAVMLEFDLSPLGKQIKSDFEWIRLRDASTARSIVSTITTGIISLTVFSFSMVMILLNQAASQMSNRMLESMIGNRTQQVVLGCYIGSIFYSLFLLSSVRDIDSGIYVPALSIYLLLIITVLDIFLFIYFLHYVTESVKFETVVDRIHKITLKALCAKCSPANMPLFIPSVGLSATIHMPSTDYFQDVDQTAIVKLAEKKGHYYEFLHTGGSFLLKGTPLLQVHSSKKIGKGDIQEILNTINLYSGQPIEVNPFFGFHQLAEVAIKALSPGINDPQTAVLVIRALSNLFLHLLENTPTSTLADSAGEARVHLRAWDFPLLFTECFYPIWDYGKNDYYIQNALRQMLQQMKQSPQLGNNEKLLNIFLNKIKDIAPTP